MASKKIRARHRMLLFAFVITPLYCWAPSAYADEPVTGTSESGIFAGEDPQSIEEIQELESHVADLIEKLSPVTVGLHIGPALGTGVIYNSEGIILTAAHVISEPGRTIRVRFPDGRTANAVSLGLYRGLDVGLVQITDDPPGEEGWPHIELGDYEEIELGTWVLTLGHPGGFKPERPPVARLGRVLRINEKGFRTDCTLTGGDSGGPLFNLSGEVVGIHSWIAGPTNNFHVSVKTFETHWEQLMAGEVLELEPKEDSE